MADYANLRNEIFSLCAGESRQPQIYVSNYFRGSKNWQGFCLFSVLVDLHKNMITSGLESTTEKEGSPNGFATESKLQGG